MATKKEKYIKFLNEHDGFKNWIKNSPFQVVGFSITEELELKLIFRNHCYLFEDDKPEFIEGDFKNALLD
tara:strand:- start:3124 stop:3333 length:210 start_codon:yes stop_codon:yes gene_type:complete